MNKVLKYDEIIEGNKLIYNFMIKDFKTIKDDKYLVKYNDNYSIIEICNNSLDYYNLNYHKSYSKLFEVIERIEDDSYSGDEYFTTLKGHHFKIELCVNLYSDERIFISECSGLQSSNKIQNIWCAIVEFLKKYNLK